MTGYIQPKIRGQLLSSSEVVYAQVCHQLTNAWWQGAQPLHDLIFHIRIREQGAAITTLNDKGTTLPSR